MKKSLLILIFCLTSSFAHAGSFLFDLSAGVGMDDGNTEIGFTLRPGYYTEKFGIFASASLWNHTDDDDSSSTRLDATSVNLLGLGFSYNINEIFFANAVLGYAEVKGENSASTIKAGTMYGALEAGAMYKLIDFLSVGAVVSNTIVGEVEKTEAGATLDSPASYHLQAMAFARVSTEAFALIFGL